MNDRLSRLGFCSACASSAAYAYVKIASQKCVQWMGNFFKTASSQKEITVSDVPEDVCNVTGFSVGK
ncbi:MAG: hypothetical protein J6P29_01785 [Acetobacter sp.]|nr:hypothetical protein [Acetobacter sp.]